MQKIRYAMAAGAALFIASAAGAQMPGRTTLPRTSTSSASVPAGMCQIWIDCVHADRQPKPTTCEVARARVPNNGRIIYGTGASSQYPTTQRAPVYGSAGTYDPRRDPRNAQYDPRLDRRNSRYDRRYDDEYSRKQEKIREQYLKKQQKNREQYERKMEKAREQEAEPDHLPEHHPVAAEDESHVRPGVE